VVQSVVRVKNHYKYESSRYERNNENTSAGASQLIIF
jgi:hypothetical protein